MSAGDWLTAILIALALAAAVALELYWRLDLRRQDDEERRALRRSAERAYVRDGGDA